MVPCQGTCHSVLTNSRVVRCEWVVMPLTWALLLWFYQVVGLDR